MKKTLLYLVLLAVTVSGFAQSGGVTGSWLLTKVQLKSETAYPYQIFEFKEDGKLLAMGYEMGQWKYDAGARRLTLQSKRDKDFNGSSKVLTLNENELTINKNGDIYYYERVHPQQISQKNKTAPLTGTWKLSGTDYPFAVVQFDLPEDFKLIQASDGETDRSSGTWMYVPDEPAVIFIGFSHLLRGKAALADVSADGFTLKLADRTLKAQRLKTDANNIERLTFKEEDFPEDAEPDESRLPWRDFDTMVQVLNDVASIQYTYGQLIEEFNILKHTSSIFSKISVDPAKPSVRFTNILVSGSDSSQFSENYKGTLSQSHNAFFPKEEPWPYRITGTEKVTVPAGTFDCTVIEGVDGEKKIKYWMINDMPGVYAKIIQEQIDPFGDLSYSIQELEKINYKNEK